MVIGLTQVSVFPHVTDFEASFGDWVNSGNDDFDWSLIDNSSTPSTGTGPQSSPYGGNFSNGYTHLESSSPN